MGLRIWGFMEDRKDMEVSHALTHISQMSVSRLDRSRSNISCCIVIRLVYSPIVLVRNNDEIQRNFQNDDLRLFWFVALV